MTEFLAVVGAIAIAWAALWLVMTYLSNRHRHVWDLAGERVSLLVRQGTLTRSNERSRLLMCHCGKSRLEEAVVGPTSVTISPDTDSAWRIYDLLDAYDRNYPARCGDKIRDWLGAWRMEKLEEVWASSDFGAKGDYCGEAVVTAGSDRGYCLLPDGHGGRHDWNKPKEGAADD